MIPLTFEKPGLAYAAASFVLAICLGVMAVISAPLLNAAHDDRSKLERLSRVSAHAETLRARIASGAIPAAGDEPDVYLATTDLRDWLGDTAERSGLLIDSVSENQAEENAGPVLLLEANAPEKVIARYLNELGQETSPAIVLGYTLNKNDYWYGSDEDSEEETLTFSLRVTPLSVYNGDGT